ncbi:ATP-binding protein [Aquibium sp. ELW1220]|uniref:ATP-binding protein n=1 Tax=Aquibium sp. ELW1220 TaxID=2976766 RepID=UPI0025B11016|nr:ATP-binding protein [Aquibium sp. ELW1220]MDN2584291.1 ATP-binding protein [Aquibium sp. ELW1220]
MMMGDELKVPLEIARRFAALSSSFDPLDAVRAALGAAGYEPVDAATILAKLRADCTIDLDDSSRWVMRPSPREKTLLATEPGSALAGIGNLLPDDEASRLIRGAYLGTGPATTEIIDSLIAQPSDNVVQLEALTGTLSQLGRAARFHDRFSTLRSALNHAETIRRAGDQLAGGFYGHDELREQLADWIDNPPPEQRARAFYIDGLPGVGKSFLLAKTIQEARARSNPIVLTFDFDRRGLSLIEGDSLTMELARQLSDEVPQHAARLVELRGLLAQEASNRYRRSGSDELPFAFAEAMRAALEKSGRSVLLVLDTLEVLRGYGDSHPVRLFSYLDQLVRSGIGPLAIVAAGRGNSLEPLEPFQVARRWSLTGLEPDMARRLLKDLGTPAAAVADIVARAKGNPLLLRLAARIAMEGSPGPDWAAGDRPELAAAYLYRAILSRIEDPLLRDIAKIGLVLPLVDAAAIRQVLAPAIDKAVDEVEAGLLLERLRTNHWLVVDDTATGWVRHRSDIRPIMLPLIYEEEPHRAAAVNRLAAAFFDQSAPDIALYHRLQLMRDGDPVPKIAATAAQSFTDQMIAELPDPAADALRLARGERSRSGLGRANAASDTGQADPAAHSGAPSSTLVRDLGLLLEKGDMAEAESLYRTSFENIDELETAAGALALCHRWLSGRWSLAQRQFAALKARGFEAGETDGPLYRLVILEMRAEFAFDKLVEQISIDDAFCRSAQLTYRDSPQRRLNDGPLAFALLADYRPHTISGGWRDAIGAAATGMDDDSLAGHAFRDAQSVRERYGLESDPDTPGHETVAVLNPYSRPIGNLFTLARSPRLHDYLNGVMTNFDAMTEFPFRLREGQATGARLLSGPSQGIDYLAAAGATADWLGAFTFFFTPPHMPQLARRAERWRRAAAGSWEFGDRRPEGWTDPAGGIDHGTRDWLSAALGHANSVEEAARQIGFWASSGRWPASGRDGYDLGTRARQRLDRAVCRGIEAVRRRGDESVETACVRELLALGLSRSIAVPVAVLVLRGGGRPSSRGPAMRALAAAAGEAFEHLMSEGQDHV